MQGLAYKMLLFDNTQRQRWGLRREGKQSFKKKLSSVVLVFYHYHHLPKATKWHLNIQFNQLSILNSLCVIRITSLMFITLTITI